MKRGFLSIENRGIQILTNIYTLNSTGKVMLTSEALTLLQLGFWFDTQWLKGVGGNKKYPTIDIALLVSLEEITLHDYKLTHIIKFGPKDFRITSLFCLRQHFSVMTSFLGEANFELLTKNLREVIFTTLPSPSSITNRNRVKLKFPYNRSRCWLSCAFNKALSLCLENPVYPTFVTK